jgi:hypothetical protein
MTAEKTVSQPKFYEGPTDILGDVHLRQRFFTYRCSGGLIAGKTFNVMFTIERPARIVWPCFKDLNCWQNVYHHYYSGVIGDLEGKTFHLSSTPDGPALYRYKVERVIPEHLIVISQPVSDEVRAAGFSPDTHVFMLNEHGGRTVATILMQHASLLRDRTEDEALEPWRTMSRDSHMKWRDFFIPTLKKLVAGAQ